MSGTGVRDMHSGWSCLKIAKQTLVPMAVLAQVAFAGYASAQSVELNEISHFYERGDFSHVLVLCDAALKQDSGNVVIHYYRANALLTLGRDAEAKIEYRQTREFSRDPQLRQYCDAALQALRLKDRSEHNRLRPGMSANLMAKSETVGQSTNVKTSLDPQTAEAINRPSVVPLATASPTVDRISQQADEISLQVLQQGSVLRNAKLRGGEDGAAAIQKRAEREAYSMSRAHWTDRFGNEYPLYTQEEIDAVVNKGLDDAQDFIGRARQSANEAQAFAERKAYETQTSAANLQTQLKAGPNSAVHLLEDGTNLFVRNYASMPGESNITPAQASVSDYGRPETASFPVPLKATPKSLEAALHSSATQGSEQGTTTDVFGKVLKSTGQ